MEKNISIAIDGPAGAGKSTVAKIVADKLGFVYIDTGAMYRALTWKAIHSDVNLEDEKLLTNLLHSIDIRLMPTHGGKQKVFVNDEDVTEAIRSVEVTNSVSIVAKHHYVRLEMVERQRQLAASRPVVMDGRDIGTHVLPKAEVKIFFIATVDERAKRRYEEMLQKGMQADLETLKIEIARRDKLDSERESSPLKKAEDAITVDTTYLTIDEVVTQILNIVKERVGPA
ncbi:(d)CMP kinase [Bacillus sp. HMF5848]|uniref:(d)CMP kinase n=1 Tax=Bacillus sp. HMF5848 TaxID=2495421 RepID=UPI000F7A60C2|nr:(d)CMP kinase [Bacillus sp. HMF5848]RSK27451.1 (d)CMP kinase [Bacillus sp. HMF5848]